MKFLGIDYGRRKIGLAVSDGRLAEPYKVINYTNNDKVVVEIAKIIDKLQVQNVIVGVSEGEMGEESREFAKKLDAKTFDETLTSYDAQRLSIQSNMSRKKRKQMEDAFAATVMLQSYLDNV